MNQNLTMLFSFKKYYESDVHSFGMKTAMLKIVLKCAKISRVKIRTKAFIINTQILFDTQL